MIRLTVTLAPGKTMPGPGERTSLERSTVRPPRLWQSWLRGQCPPGTDFAGATYTRERVRL